MKNILVTQENLRLYNKAGVIIYKFIKDGDESFERTYNENGKALTYKDSNDYSWERTYDKNGNELTFKDSDGNSWEKTYDSNGNNLTYKDSNGNSWERTYDSNGNNLTYKDSNGLCRGFGIPEFTMEQLVEKVGNFKLIK